MVIAVMEAKREIKKKQMTHLKLSIPKIVFPFLGHPK